MVKALACSTCLLEKGMGPPLRGSVHSVFAAAANLIFADSFLLSLNALISLPGHPTLHRETHLSPVEKAENWLMPDGPLRHISLHGEVGGLLMPNGVLLSARPGEFPFDRLRAGMPVVLGAGWLSLEALSCSLDFAHCPRWDPHVDRPAGLDEELVRSNGLWLTQFCRRAGLRKMPELEGSENETIFALAKRLCGRGSGLTPSGDDFLAGWMAAGWLLYEPQPPFLAICQHICQLARQRTHVLSQCWLAYAAEGNVALPIGEVLAALTMPDRDRLESAAMGLLALGATSGFDLLQGILYCIQKSPTTLRLPNDMNHP